METKPSAELQKILEQAEKALIQAGKDARKLAEQTGTLLVCVPESGQMGCPQQNTSSLPR